MSCCPNGCCFAFGGSLSRRIVSGQGRTVQTRGHSTMRRRIENKYSRKTETRQNKVPVLPGSTPVCFQGCSARCRMYSWSKFSQEDLDTLAHPERQFRLGEVKWIVEDTSLDAWRNFWLDRIFCAASRRSFASMSSCNWPKSASEDWNKIECASFSARRQKLSICACT